MDIVLTPKELGQFQEALLSAFNRNELKQVALFALEEDYDNIVSSGAFRSEALDLVKWANANNKVGALLSEARNENSGNVLLRKFEEYIKQTRQAPPVLPEAPDPLKGHKEELIQILSSLPISDTFIRRSSLLDGIPSAGNIGRDENGKRSDLNLILTGLARQGKLATGEWPLVKLIGNALPEAAGLETEARLKEIQAELAQA